MAKKLNKKVAIISVVLVMLVLGTIAGVLVGPKIARRLGIGQDPEKALAKARQLVEAGDYENAEIEFGRAYAWGKTDAYKTERLFELADFHLISNDQHEPDWGKARGCWQQIITKTDPDNIKAHQKLLDFMYQVAEAGDSRVWKTVNEYTTDLMAALEQQDQEPDTELLTRHAKSLLRMAQRGESTNRRELLDQSVQILEPLIEQNPQKNELYLLRAQAAELEGELNQLAGNRDAVEKSRQQAFQWLEKGIDQSADKATATANLLMFKLQSTRPDPNEIDKIRTEIAARTQDLPPSAEMLSVKSIAFENPGNMSVKAEVNQAIEAIRQAHEMEPDNMEYLIRLFQLMYRKGSSLNDPDAVADAINLAEQTLQMPGTQDVPGPEAGLRRQYRYVTNAFLAEVYLEKAYQADNDSTAAEWVAKAEPRIEEIRHYISTSENPIVQKFDGMLALAKGDRGRAIRLMYAAYEQSKVLDQEGQPSQIDPVLCMTLADVMAETEELGMQREFLEKAIINRKRPVFQKPYIMLDYAEVLAKLRGWTGVLNMTTSYQNRFGSDLRSQTLRTQALIMLDQFEPAAEALAQIPAEEPIVPQLQINLQTRKINQIMQSTVDEQSQQRQELTAEQQEQINRLRAERNDTFGQWLDRDAASVDSQTAVEVCRDMIRNNQTDTATAFMDQYLAAHPDNINMKVLRLQSELGNPQELTADQNFDLQQQAFRSLSDPLRRCLGLSQLHRSRGDYDQARQALAQLPPDAAEDPQVLREKFDLAVQSDDLATAESLLRPLRNQNLDGCEGNRFSAQLEFARGNYDLALRRLDEGLTLQPLSSQLYFLKSRVYHQLEDFESAITMLQQAQMMEPLNALYARHLASVLFARNTKLGSKVTPQQQTQAQQAITRAMILNPSDWQLQSVYAEIISETNPDQALSIRQLLVNNYPTAENALMLGNMAQRMAKSEYDTSKRSGLIEQANKAYQLARQMEPDNETVQQVYADFLRMTGKPDEAIAIIGDDENLQWKYYLRNSQFDQAQEILDSLYEQNPQDITVLRGLVLTAEGKGDRDQVKVWLDKLNGLDDSKESELWLFQKYLDNGFAAEVQDRLAGFKERYPEENIILLIEAWTALRNGNLDESLSLTNRYLETETENASAWRLRGRLYRLMNRPQQAISDLQRSKRIKADPMVRLELASVYNEMGNPQGAIGELKEGLNDPQAPSQLWFTIESTYKKMNDIKGLEQFYLSTLEKYPQNIFWLYRIGNFYLEQANYAKARQYLKTAWDLSLQRENQELNVLVAYLESLYKSGQNDEAFSLASQYVDTPAAAAVYTYMALVQLKLGQADKASDSFRMALEKAGVNDRMQELVMDSMTQTVGQEAIQTWCRQQLEKDPDYLPGHMMAYRLAQKDERFNTAAEHLDKCLDTVGQEHPAWLSLAMKKSNVLILAYTKTADKDYLNRSILLFETMLEKQPANPSLLNNLAYLLIDNDTQIDTALEYARKAQQSDPSNAVYLDTYGYALCKVGRYEEAERNLLRGIQLYEASGVAIPWDMYKHMGMAHEGQGNTRQALDYYRKALDAAADIPEAQKQQLQQKLASLDQ